jgi:hypothetical protein
MKRLDIETTQDEYDCDTCGCSSAYGGILKLDGVEILSKEAYAHCFNVETWEVDELLALFLEKQFGIEVYVDGEKLEGIKFP